jgi:hypothetical protein
MGPDTHPGEEVALGEALNVSGPDIKDAPFVNDAGGNVAGRDEVSEPLRGICIVLVVVGGHEMN